MLLYLQKGLGKKYWIFLDGSDVGISATQKDAHDIPMVKIQAVKKKILAQLKHYPKFDGFDIKSHVVGKSKKSIKKLDALGKLYSITYKSEFDGKLYQHNFKTKPTIKAASEKKLDIIGGRYSITDRGIVG